MNFQRGQDPIRALDIGMNVRHPEIGQKFNVRFRLRTSCPDYYPLQRQEKAGNPVIAIAVSYSKYSSDNMECIIMDLQDRPDPLNKGFFAEWIEEVGCWAIQ
jgi:hypothetical protein